MGEKRRDELSFPLRVTLLDGQHRLRAVVQTGVSIESCVVFNLPQKVFDTIDTGRNRTVGDLLDLEGEAHGTVMGPALRLLYIHDEFGSVAQMSLQIARLITNRDLMETRKKHPGIDHSASFITGVKGLAKYVTAANATVVHYQFQKMQAHHADSFFIRLARAQDMEEDHPILALKKEAGRNV